MAATPLSPATPAPVRLNPQLVMWRDNLDALPPLTLPAGYALRCFRDGDEPAWERIIGESFQNPYVFNQLMRADPAFRPGRVLLICRSDQPVATASAWHRPAKGTHVGYLHMVGTLPGESGKGLGLWASLACLHHFVMEGRTAAMLQTDDFRIPAIKTYLKLGFAPQLVDENQRQRWRDIFTAIGKPELIGKFAEQVDGAVVKN
jgi:mycothiol synthase